MVEIRKLAEKILDFLCDEEEKRGHLSIPLTTLYKTFEKEASFEDIQRSIEFLADRDFIAPFSYSLTAKGRRERSLRSKP